MKNLKLILPQVLLLALLLSACSNNGGSSASEVVSSPSPITAPGTTPADPSTPVTPIITSPVVTTPTTEEKNKSHLETTNPVIDLIPAPVTATPVEATAPEVETIENQIPDLVESPIEIPTEIAIEIPVEIQPHTDEGISIVDLIQPTLETNPEINPTVNSPIEIDPITQPNSETDSAQPPVAVQEPVTSEPEVTDLNPDQTLDIKGKCTAKKSVILTLSDSRKQSHSEKLTIKCVKESYAIRFKIKKADLPFIFIQVETKESN